MSANYRFRIQALFGGAQPYFQLTVGMTEERDFEMIPAHRSAFARLVAIKEFHATEADAQIELSVLLEWLSTRSGATDRVVSLEDSDVSSI